MELERPRVTPPPAPKRVLLPAERPNFDGLDLAAEVTNDSWRHSYTLLALLNESREPNRKPETQEKRAEAVAETVDATPATPKSTTKLRLPWLFWTMTLLFIGLALGLFVWIPKFQSGAPLFASRQIKRDLERNLSSPDPSPTTQALDTGDPSLDLKPPTRPTRD